MKLELKLNPETKQPVWNDQGQVIYIDRDDSDKELPLDPVGLYSKVSALGVENQKHREKHQELTKLYEPFKGIEDIADWKKKADEALTTVANFSDKDMMTADKVQKLKADMTSAYEDKLKAKDTAIADMTTEHNTRVESLNAQIRNLLISSKFSASKYFGKNGLTNLLPDMAESFFGRNFKVEVDDKGKPIERAFFDNGDPVLSKVNPGQPAPFEEAIGLIINAYPNRDAIMRSSGGGSGGRGGEGGEGGNGSGDLASLEKQLAKAKEANDSQLVVVLTNRIHEEKMRMRGAA